jgi:dolichyl-phosphate beta-glucosyltransferase
MEEKLSRETMTLSVIIPAYNEEGRIGKSLETIARYLNETGYRHEVVVVDDGSEDLTTEVVEGFARGVKNFGLLKNGVNRGKGYSIRHGVLYSKGNIILMSDADLSTPIEEVEKLLDPILSEGYQVAIGSRALPGSDVRVHQPWYRENMGKVFNLFVQALVIGGIKDTQCGFKCFTGRAAKAIFSRQALDGFSFDVEALFIARRLGYRIKEVPIVWINSPASRVHVLRDPLRMFRDLWRIRLWDLRGRYG